VVSCAAAALDVGEPRTKTAAASPIRRGDSAKKRKVFILKKSGHARVKRIY